MKLLALCAAFLPCIAFAEEKKEDVVRIRSVFTSEFNFVNSGNSMEFSSHGKKGSTYPTKETLGPEDRKRAFWQNSGGVVFMTDYFDLFTIVESSGDDLNWPNSVGLRALLLIPIQIGNKKFGVGFSHHSAHNLVEERYGRGTETNGVYVRASVVDEKGWTLSGWGAYNFLSQNESPFVFTSAVREMPKKDLEETLWSAGVAGSMREKKVSVFFPMEISAARGGVASVKMRSQVLYHAQKQIGVGPYAEHRLNVRESEKFGSDEWLIGAMMESRF